jgi:hypothetical protein
MPVKTLSYLSIKNASVTSGSVHIFDVGPVAGGTIFIPKAFYMDVVTDSISAGQFEMTLGEAAAYNNMWTGPGEYNFSGLGLWRLMTFHGFESAAFGTAVPTSLTAPSFGRITMPSPIGVKFGTLTGSAVVSFILEGWFL